MRWRRAESEFQPEMCFHTFVCFLSSVSFSLAHPFIGTCSRPQINGKQEDPPFLFLLFFSLEEKTVFLRSSKQHYAHTVCAFDPQLNVPWIPKIASTSMRWWVFSWLIHTLPWERVLYSDLANIHWGDKISSKWPLTGWLVVGRTATLSKKLDRTKSFQSSKNLYAHTALNKSYCETHYLENRWVERL